MKDALYALVTRPADLEIGCFDLVRNIEAVIPLIPSPGPHSMTLIRVLGLAGPHLIPTERASDCRATRPQVARTGPAPRRVYNLCFGSKQNNWSRSEMREETTLSATADSSDEAEAYSDNMP